MEQKKVKVIFFSEEDKGYLWMLFTLDNEPIESSETHFVSKEECNKDFDAAIKESTKFVVVERIDKGPVSIQGQESLIGSSRKSHVSSQRSLNEQIGKDQKTHSEKMFVKGQRIDVKGTGDGGND